MQEQALRPHITEALVAGDPKALADFDQAVRTMVLGNGVERVKLWSPDGRIVYADEHRLIGARFKLGAEDLETLRSGRATSSLSNLSAPENRFEPTGHRLLEVYVRTSTPDGHRLLFESYQRYDGVVASAHRIWRDLTPALLVTLLALELLQLPLAWRLTRRIQEGQREREVLHNRIVGVADAERQRIAGDLHDGVVQTLAGVSYSLAAASVDLHATGGHGSEATGEVVATAAALTRRSISELRSLLVEIYPPNLREIGLDGALANLLTALPAKGVTPHLVVPPHLVLPDEVEQLLYRATQEAVRNVLSHAHASRVEVVVSMENGLVVLEVRDDGRGFSVRPTSTRPSHFGLRLLEEMAGRLNGRLQIHSVPGLGTALHLEVPAS